MQAANPIYVFIDESGNLDFTNKGTNHFVMSAVMTDDPCKSAAVMQALKYDLMLAGSDQLSFHATENSRGTRSRVADIIQSLDRIRVHSIYADKHLAHQSLHSTEKFYSLFGRAISKWLLKAIHARYDQVIIIFDVALTKRQQNVFFATVKPALNSLGRPYRILFHPVKEDMNGQIADYYAWSMFRKLESSDFEPMKALRGPVHDEFNVFALGHTRYW